MPDVLKLSRSSQEDMKFWKAFEGQVLDGQFPLEGFVATSPTGATFASRLSGQDKSVLIKVVRYGSLGWERLSASWALAKELQHKHLVRVHACGMANLDGLRVAYAVTDSPDGKLVDVLEERRLSEEEGRQLLLDSAQALQYLHQRGLVHSRVQPAAILSVDDTIKLSSDHLMKAGERERQSGERDPYAPPEFATEGYSAASDIWSLGLTTVEVLTGNLPKSSEISTAVPRTSYSDVLQRCFEMIPENRWSARQIVASLQDTPVKQTPSAKPATAAVQYPEVPREVSFGSATEPSLMARAKYAVPVMCVLLVGIFWLVSSRGKAPQPPAVKAPQSDQPRADKAAQGDMDRSKEKPAAGVVLDPVTTETAKPHAFPVNSRKPPAAAGPHTWSVVVYTYWNADTAEDKAAEINKKWPEMKAHVVATKDGTAHLVLLGSGLDREGASRLLSQALAAQLPQDSYIQNF